MPAPAVAAAEAAPAPAAAAAAPSPAAPLHRPFEPQLSWDPHVEAYLSGAFGAQRFAAISAALCRPPLRTCVRVNTIKADAEHVVSELESSLAAAGASPAAISRLPCAPPALLLQGSGPNLVDYAHCLGREAVINRRAGEAVLRGAEVFVPGVLALSAGLEPGELVAVSVALEQTPAGGGAPRYAFTRGTVLPPAVAAGSSSSGGGGGGGNGGEAAAGKTGGGGSGSGSGSNRLYIGIGRMCMGRAEVFRTQAGVAIQMVERVYSVPSVPAHLKGSFMLQNLPSVAAALTLAPIPGSRVIDMCAAPGGKSTLLAQIMSNQGQIIAADRSHGKVDDIRALAEELGASCITAVKMDSTKSVMAPGAHAHASDTHAHACSSGMGNGGAEADSPVEKSGLDKGDEQQQDGKEQQQDGEQQDSKPQEQQQQVHKVQLPTAVEGISAKALARLQRRAASMRARGIEPPVSEMRSVGLAPRACPGFPPGSFDFVLLDAPCSGLGLRPRLLMEQVSLPLLRSTARYQRRLIDCAVTLLRPGGAMVYSTCTINPGENEANVRYLLDTYPFMRLVQSACRLGGPGLAAPADAAQLRGAVAACCSNGAAAAAAEAAAAAAAAPASAAAGEGLKEAGHSQAPGPDSPADVDLPPSGAWLTPEEAALVQRFDPAAPLDTIGFFAARFVKDAAE